MNQPHLPSTSPSLLVPLHLSPSPLPPPVVPYLLVLEEQVKGGHAGDPNRDIKVCVYPLFSRLGVLRHWPLGVVIWEEELLQLGSGKRRGREGGERRRRRGGREGRRERGGEGGGEEREGRRGRRGEGEEEGGGTKEREGRGREMGGE